jgi:hypothetical protein
VIRELRDVLLDMRVRSGRPQTVSEPPVQPASASIVALNTVSSSPLLIAPTSRGAEQSSEFKLSKEGINPVLVSTVDACTGRRVRVAANVQPMMGLPLANAGDFLAQLRACSDRLGVKDEAEVLETPDD